MRDTVLYPELMIPLVVGRDKSIKLIDDALKTDNIIGVVTQKDAKVEEPEQEHLYEVGTAALITKMIRMQDGTLRIIVHGFSRFRIKNYTSLDPYFIAETRILSEQEERNNESEALMLNVKKLFEKFAEMVPYISSDLTSIVKNMDSPGRLADLIAHSLRISTDEKQQVLELIDVVPRLERVSYLLSKEINIIEIRNKIQSEVKGEIDKTQREYYLREQLKAIQKELGEGDERELEVNEFKERIEKAGLPPDAKKVAEKELKRLSKMHPSSAEYSVCRTYLEWLTELPWATATEDNLDVKDAARVLDEDHYDLEKVKKRMLEYLAVRQLKSDMKGPILCFVGPPGVGKTSLGKSIARALGRKFIRISLGGVHDEAEIRGHRRTYVGALPGRIIQGIKRAGTSNPVFMMDEVDKIGMDFRGDPSAALLEVLDPEQNFSFSDHYLEVSFDLSKVMFIATANFLEPVPPALKDRMEVIELPGYTDDEKLRIATQFLVPKELDAHGLKTEQLQFEDEAILEIIHSYTREAGVRNLEREIANICRGVAKEIVERILENTAITRVLVQKYLGPQKFYPELAERTSIPGVAVGVAWTPTGGDIIFVEAAKAKGKRTLTLTGHLGEVMKESAQAALSYIRSKAKDFHLNPDFFEESDIHIHVPAGAIQKDGPSAGITIFIALLSLLTNRLVKSDVAMTGEITLRGAVLPIGGLKEKILAAKRAGIKHFILPDRNKTDLDEIPEHIKDGFTFHLIKIVDEAVNVALQEGIPTTVPIAPKTEEGKNYNADYVSKVN
ncbi:MAG: endopeptidase La [Candidatus Fischerbacteria bacterium RBG_13_37_8]|uniref:Lon protease n=1 Tax=Candidatus Fischerbacteria bacterium RBG_13_37_8 TaxID=1817863 RepID=A0A1F5V4L6_9BACT|nr:MAG: endopeptidase La [Candidatus Fischerbacteria bacterium RBG_13_37_8]